MKRILVLFLVLGCLFGFGQEPPSTLSAFGIDGIEIRHGKIGATEWNAAGVRHMQDGSGKEWVELDPSKGGAGFNLPHLGPCVVPSG